VPKDRKEEGGLVAAETTAKDGVASACRKKGGKFRLQAQDRKREKGHRKNSKKKKKKGGKNGVLDRANKKKSTSPRPKADDQKNCYAFMSG